MSGPVPFLCHWRLFCSQQMSLHASPEKVSAMNNKKRNIYLSLLSGVCQPLQLYLSGERGEEKCYVLIAIHPLRICWASFVVSYYAKHFHTIRLLTQDSITRREALFSLKKTVYVVTVFMFSVLWQALRKGLLWAESPYAVDWKDSPLVTALKTWTLSFQYTAEELSAHSWLVLVLWAHAGTGYHGSKSLWKKVQVLTSQYSGKREGKGAARESITLSWTLPQSSSSN